MRRKGPAQQAKLAPPRCEEALLARTSELVGCTVGELAQRFALPLPAEAKRSKGFVGTLVEQALGASAASRAEADFAELGIELKTIPLRADGYPAESTFVTSISAARAAEWEWGSSPLWHKLQRVLWVPIECAGTAPLAQRRFGRPLLWSPTALQQALLRDDFDEIIGRLALGNLAMLDAQLGRCLQARPKAADASVRRTWLDARGTWQCSLPLGFYLRAAFTASLLNTT